MHRSADFSRCGRYRYRLVREWSGGLFSDGGGTVNFVMLNPSTADADHDDPTVRRCIGFARRWRFGRLVVTNLFAWRSTDPTILRHADAPEGPRNRDWLMQEASVSDRVVCAWGVGGSLFDQGETVALWLRSSGIRLHCLSLTAAGLPRHPLYVRRDAVPTLWRPDL